MSLGTLQNIEYVKRSRYLFSVGRFWQGIIKEVDNYYNPIKNRLFSSGFRSKVMSQKNFYSIHFYSYLGEFDDTTSVFTNTINWDH